MARIESGRPLIQITEKRTQGGVCPDIDLRFIAEPGQNYSFASGTFIQISLVDESGNPIQVTDYSNIGGNITVEIDSDTAISLNGNPLGEIVNWTPISVNVEDESGNPAPLTGGSNLTGNILTAVVESDTDIDVNGSNVGQITNWQTIDVLLEDSGGNPVVPDSIALVGNALTLEVNPGGSPAGVSFDIIWPEQRTSYRNGDIGWRSQNAWFNFNQPAYPAKFAELDMSSANYWYILANTLTVNGISSTTRFVDVNGVQSWGAANNVDLAVIDKLTGLMFLRNSNLFSANTWNNWIDNALSYSVIIQGVTYDDWYLMSLNEYRAILGTFAIGGVAGWNDPVTTNRISNIGSGNHHSATTNAENSAASECARITPDGSTVITQGKGSSLFGIYVRKAFNLITP